MRLLITAATMLLLFSACQKDLLPKEDALNAEAVSNDVTGPGEFSNCKLRRIVHKMDGDDPFSPLDNALFTYNSAGNPISLIYNHGTHNRNSYFFYDKKNRLVEWRESFDQQHLMEATAHKYGYNSEGVLNVDTAFHYAQYEYTEEDAEFMGWLDTTIILLAYDSQGRIVKESIRNLRTGATRNPTYTYDNRGNLGIIGWKSSSYDNKVSIFRAHPVFQFIFRNYSRNNAGVQSKYNSKGLPLSGRPLNDQFFNAYSTAYGSEYGIVKAIYDCQ